MDINTQVQITVAAERLWARANGCHVTCVELFRSLPRNITRDWTLVRGTDRGTTHVWIESGDTVIDPQWFIFDGSHLFTDRTGRIAEQSWSMNDMRVVRDAEVRVASWNIRGQESMRASADLNVAIFS